MKNQTVESMTYDIIKKLHDDIISGYENGKDSDDVLKMVRAYTEVVANCHSG